MIGSGDDERARRLGAVFERLAPMRVGPLRPGAFTSRLHTERAASILGIALGVAFAICFLTGLLSWAIQNPPSWFSWPSRPAGLYRLTQGLHVAAGTAAIPILLAKLWVAYPHLFTWPPLRDVAHAVERASLPMLVGGAIFLLFTGVANTWNWYPWTFFFPTAHRWAAWITIGALVAHIGAKASIVRRSLRRGQPGRTDDDTRDDDTYDDDRDDDTHDDTGDDAGALSRRGLFALVAGASAGLTALTIGQTVAPLRRLAVLAPRRAGEGVQGVPVNKSAVAARVVQAARDPEWRLRVTGRVERTLELSREDLAALPQRQADLPIACVEGWSTSATWVGVPVRHLLHLAGARPGSRVRVESLQPRGLFRASDLNPSHAADPDTLLALRLNGEILHIDHGYPVRLIGPNRPGVMQTKWVSELIVS